MFKKIMIATDGSEPSNRAAKLGIDLARVHKAQIVAVYVVDVNRLIQLPGYTMIPGLKDKLLGLMIEEGQYVTEEIEQMANAAGVTCSKVVLRGHPSDELLRYSLESKADLLVMGSVGKSGLGRFLLGSVAEKVAQHSKVPVSWFPESRIDLLIAEGGFSRTQAFMIV
jgi:nucleotide-binding universal stress UspA family protein